MVTIRVKENSKQAKAFMALAKTLSFVEFEENKTPNTETEKVFKDTDEGKDLSKIEEILNDKNLNKKEKTFYKKFARAVNEAREIEAGNIKGIPLEKTLNEI